MKATRANLLGEFTGKLDGLIYYRSRKNGKLYVRRQWEAKPNAGNACFGAASSAIYALHPSEGYKRDIKNYLLLYNNSKEGQNAPLWTWTNTYSRLMFAMQKALPETVDLANITREQIFSQNLPCRSIKAAIEANLLPGVRDYERFTAEI